MATKQPEQKTAREAAAKALQPASEPLKSGRNRGLAGCQSVAGPTPILVE